MPLDQVFQFSNSNSINLHVGDCIGILRTLPEAHFHVCITSPPYYNLRDYAMSGQIGLESTPDAYVAHLVEVFREVRRVLRDDGTLWLNLGDSYARTGGSDRTVSATALVGNTRNSIVQRGDRTQKVPCGLKSKDLIGIPWLVAFALRSDGWFLRSDIIWAKNNAAPESVKDRPTSSHEHVFLLSKAQNYYYDADAIREPHASKYSRDAIAKAGRPGGDRPKGDNFSKQHRRETGATTPATRADRAALLHPGGRNCRNVWNINTRPFKGAHFATMPPDLIRPCLLAGCPDGGYALDPFAGAGTTGLVAAELARHATLIELNPDYADITRTRLGHLINE